MEAQTDDFLQRIAMLNEIGIALSKEKDFVRLMEIILVGAKALTNADAGTLYTVSADQYLHFEIIRTDSLNISMGGTLGTPINFKPIPLYGTDNSPNTHMVAAYAAIKRKTVNIADAYTSSQDFDFSGTRVFDQNTGYRSKSFLTVPLENHENELLGVLQLINAKDRNTSEVQSFTPEDQQLAESLASQAAIAMSNQKLIDNLKQLFESFIKVIASAIDDKSPYTGGHCARVPILAEMLAEAAQTSRDGALQTFHLSPEQMYELKMAAWLHDCGKVTTPEYVVDKATKLETIFDRIKLIDTRFEVIRRDVEIRFLKKKTAALENNTPEKVPLLERAYLTALRKMDEEQAFIQQCNRGSEFMAVEQQERIKVLAKRYPWTNRNGEALDFLSEDEVYNLNIPKGTITKEEREIINHHVVATIKMLNALPFPRSLTNVPEIAGGHHERMDGTGYPKGLTRDQMSIQARILAIADVFEALTARDRPYKKGKTLSQSLKILGFMKKDNHIDPDLFQVFIDQEIYLRYAREYLNQDQIDTVDKSQIPGYQPVRSPDGS
jgi:HD-GYP domain-containing protein (c-di-GMP phosphodiesterase class II)